jgi:hypothetical protein
MITNITEKKEYFEVPCNMFVSSLTIFSNFNLVSTKCTQAFKQKALHSFLYTGMPKQTLHRPDTPGSIKQTLLETR